MFINSLFFQLRDLIEHSPAKRDRFIMIPFIVSAVLVAVTTLAIPFSFWNFNDYVVLHYNIYFGISSFGPWLMLSLLPLSGLIVLIVNAILAMVLYLKHGLLSYFLAFISSFYNLIVLLSIILIIYINA